MIQVDKNGLCSCDCGTKCPLGKMGMEYRCTAKELKKAGIPFERPSLFKKKNFKMASGKQGTWKIECDALTKNDWEGLAFLASKILPPFGKVEGVPRGGIPFAEALEQYVTQGPLLIADDVFTTGGSVVRFRDNREAIAVVAFSRGENLHPWIHVLFQVNPFVYEI